MVDGGSAADHGSSRNIVRDAALGDGDGSVPDFHVAADAHLSGEDYVVAHIGCTCQSYLGAQQCVVTNDAAVANVDQIV